MEFPDGFATLADRYDGFILDLWGVVHDGVRPLPGAVDCLERLRRAGKRSVLLSNAPRRSGAAQAAMREMGIPDALYDGILTSGEMTRILLERRDDPFFAKLGRRVFHLGPVRDKNVIEGLDVTEVATPAEADFVLNTGPDDHRSPTSLEPFEDTLHACRAAGLPMVCANPDLEVLRGGERVICAGLLAARYEELGGEARLVGKPDPAVYDVVLEMLGVSPARVLAVGDALRTDIAGATASGLASCWVLGGIHGEALNGDATAARDAATRAGFAPVAAIPAFAW